jgi:hypothetical protein
MKKYASVQQDDEFTLFGGAGGQNQAEGQTRDNIENPDDMQKKKKKKRKKKKNKGEQPGDKP